MKEYKISIWNSIDKYAKLDKENMEQLWKELATNIYYEILYTYKRKLPQINDSKKHIKVTDIVFRCNNDIYVLHANIVCESWMTRHDRYVKKVFPFLSKIKDKEKYSIKLKNKEQLIPDTSLSVDFIFDFDSLMDHDRAVYIYDHKYNDYDYLCYFGNPEIPMETITSQKMEFDDWIAKPEHFDSYNYLHEYNEWMSCIHIEYGIKSDSRIYSVDELLFYGSYSADDFSNLDNDLDKLVFLMIIHLQYKICR